jgi:hypothetical protein
MPDVRGGVPTHVGSMRAAQSDPARTPTPDNPLSVARALTESDARVRLLYNNTARDTHRHLLHKCVANNSAVPAPSRGDAGRPNVAAISV